ncbi:rab11 family-interacting protein 3-like [Ochlerotatus camptorhynchus]|uniref:rab11 family-interacting protein 3-like n=1 Tax=Ochlerotatus camptorhynchus TaxID=644619 RepID=UPI0031E05DD1
MLQVHSVNIILSLVLKDTQNAFQSLIKTRKDLRSSQLEAKINKDQLQSARQRLESNDGGGIPSDWNRFSKSLNNIIKVVSERKDIVEYEQTIRNFSEENESLKKQINSLATNHEKALEKQKNDLKKQLDKELAQHSKQISELTIDKELAASEASIKYDQLQSRLERLNSENEDRCKAIVAQYEKLVQSLSDQKHKLREENMALQRREVELRDQFEHLQNHSTDFLLGMGRRISPIGGSQRYAEVVETVPLLGSRVENSSQQSSQMKGIDRGETSVPETVEVSSSSSSNSYRAKNHGSPQHPGVGGHVAKPRKKRKLFNQISSE